MLRRESAARRADEGATGRDDGPESARDQGMVPEQTMQGQEEDDRHEAADAGEGGDLHGSRFDVY